MVAGLTLAMVDNIVFEGGDITLAINTVMKALMIVILSLLFFCRSLLYLGKKLLTSRHFRVLPSGKPNKNQMVLQMQILFSKHCWGMRHSLYCASSIGKVEIRGDIFDAKSEFGFIEKGMKIRVVRYETGQLYVEKI